MVKMAWDREEWAFMVVAEVTLLAIPCLSSMATWAMLFTWRGIMSGPRVRLLHFLSDLM